MVVVMRADALVYRLPRTFLRAGSERVTSHARDWHSGTDYVLDALRGELRLLREPIPGDSVWVTACGLIDPPPLERMRFQYRAAAAPGAATADTTPAVTPRAGVSRDRLGDVAGVNLSVAGSKSFAIDFGSNQDAFLRQSLDLTVSGSVAPGVELTGVLSDRNTPLTAEGSTRDLQALDRVLLELKSPTTSVQLGDVDVALEQGEFGRIRRHLQGVNSGWRSGPATVRFSAASAPGEYARAEFLGTEGYQGPYPLAGINGPGAVVSGSEIVTLDGERMSRGESADYSIDYDAGRITFTNRRPMSASSHVAVQYQLASSRYRRRLVTTNGRWESRNGFVYAGVASESDDRGQPVDGVLGTGDVAILALAGDSASRAIVPEVSPGGGDYDTTRAGAGALVYVYAGPGVGRFSVPFAAVGTGRGDYEAYPVPAGTAYRYVGPGLGAYRIGRVLALPESHQLAQLGAGGRAGPIVAEVEGAVSRHDANTFSGLDDNDNVGGALRAKLGLESARLAGVVRRAGVLLTARGVDKRFAPFERLSEAFEGDRWGLQTSADLDRRREGGVEGFAESATLGELRGSLGRLTTPSGFDADRREATYRRDGRVNARAQYSWAHGRDPLARRADGGRERIQANLGLRFAWVEPSVMFLTDARRAPTDSVAAGTRTRSAGVQVASGARVPWQLSAGYEQRRDAFATLGGFEDQGETRIVRGLVRTPDAPAWGAELRLEHRALEPLATPQRTRSDLGGLRLRGEQRKLGLTGRVALEVSGDGESRRERRVIFVGSRAGAYDSLGNFVGTGDYTVSIVVSPSFDRVSRAATSAHLGWEFAPSDEWRGSRVQFDYETETRRRGDLEWMDPWVPPGTVLNDPGFARASLRQRLEGDLAPGARAAALRLRLERQVSADRAFQNFAQTLDQRNAALRWRARPSDRVTTEVEGVWRRDAAQQALSGSGGYGQTLFGSGVNAQVIVTPSAHLRVAIVGEALWSRPLNSSVQSRTLRVGPEAGFDVGARGHAELSLRRGFVSGATPQALLPSRDPAGPPRWESSGRFDFRLRESSTASASLTAVDREGQRAIVTGRAELRAFF
jgi:hypothetical protein